MATRARQHVKCLLSTSSGSSDGKTEEVREGNRSHVHFKASGTKHPLLSKQNPYEVDDATAGDHTGRQQVRHEGKLTD